MRRASAVASRLATARPHGGHGGHRVDRLSQFRQWLDADLDRGSSLYLEIGSSTSRDTINVAGTITLAGTVFLATTNGYTVQAGDTFDFVDATTFAGTAGFNTTGVTFAPGVSFNTSRFGIDGTVIAVPEPTTVSLLGAACAMVGAGVLRRRRR